MFDKLAYYAESHDWPFVALPSVLRSGASDDPPAALIRLACIYFRQRHLPSDVKAQNTSRRRISFTSGTVDVSDSSWFAFNELAYRTWHILDLLFVYLLN